MLGLLIVAVFLMALWLITRPRRGEDWGRPWHRAARELGLTALEDGVQGDTRGVTVEVREEGGHTVFRLDASDRVPTNLRVTARGSTDDVDEDEGEVPTGDAVFDSLVCVHGDPAQVTALLDWDMRQRLRAVVRDLGGQVVRGRVEAALRGVDHHPDLVVGHVRQLLTMALRLRYIPDRAAERLLDITAEDPKPEVRLKALRLLLQDHADTPWARQAAARAATDPDARLRALSGVAGQDRGVA